MVLVGLTNYNGTKIGVFAYIKDHIALLDPSTLVLMDVPLSRVFLLLTHTTIESTFSCRSQLQKQGRSLVEVILGSGPLQQFMKVQLVSFLSRSIKQIKLITRTHFVIMSSQPFVFKSQVQIAIVMLAIHRLHKTQASYPCSKSLIFYEYTCHGAYYLLQKLGQSPPLIFRHISCNSRECMGNIDFFNTD